jgi:hypothetical protein
MPATATRDSHYLLALAPLGGMTNRNDPISVALLNVAKESK